MLSSAAVLLGAALGVSAHYTFPSVNSEATWQQVRLADNWQSNGFASDVTSDQIRCFQTTQAAAPSVLNVTAGSNVIYHANNQIYHPGPIQIYMAKVPAGETFDTWNGEGSVWFKIYEDHPTFGSSLTWPANSESAATAPIPSCIPSGNYLLRVEQIALHVASTKGGAQFYLSCAQINVSGGGSKTPSNLVAFPGAYSATDPGILININYPVPTSYTNPGPAVFTC